MRFCALLVVLAGVLALPAGGAVTLWSWTGTNQISGWIEEAPGFPDRTIGSFAYRKTLWGKGTCQQAFADAAGAPGIGNAGATASQVTTCQVGPLGELLGASYAGSTSIMSSTTDAWQSNTGANNEFDLEFTLDQPMGYVIDYAFSAMHPQSTTVYSGTSLDLCDDSGVWLAWAMSGSSSPGFGRLTGVLQPGHYTLVTSSNSSGNTGPAPGLPFVSASTNMVYTFSLTPTPEPATIALLAIGGLLIKRRR